MSRTRRLACGIARYISPPSRSDTATLTPLAIFVVVLASWALRPKSRVLRGTETSVEASERARVPVAV